MGWFSISRKTSEARPLGQHQEKTAGGIAEKILSVQRGIAAKLNARAQKLGMAKTRILVAALLLGFAGYLVYIILNALF